MFIKTPLLGALALIVVSVMVRLYISILARKWMRFLVILIFLGGIIVLFVYICTLISTIKMFVDNNPYSLIIIFGVVALRAVFVNAQYWDLRFDVKSSLLSVLYIKSNFLLIRICVLYLLLVLIIRIKLSQKFKGGLKSKTHGI